jgi:hypothetical protein
MSAALEAALGWSTLTGVTDKRWSARAARPRCKARAAGRLPNRMRSRSGDSSQARERAVASVETSRLSLAHGEQRRSSAGSVVRPGFRLSNEQCRGAAVRGGCCCWVAWIGAATVSLLVFHRRSTAHEAPYNRVGCTAHLRPPQRRGMRGIAMTEVRRRAGAAPEGVSIPRCREIFRLSGPLPALGGRNPGRARPGGPGRSGPGNRNVGPGLGRVAVRSPGRTVHRGARPGRPPPTVTQPIPPRPGPFALTPGHRRCRFRRWTPPAPCPG